MHCLYRLYIFYSNHCLHIVFTMSTQCLHNISTLSTQCQCVFYRMYLFVRQIRFTRMYGNCVHRGPARPDMAIHALTWTSNPIKICITISHSKCPAPKHRETVLSGPVCTTDIASAIAAKSAQSSLSGCGADSRGLALRYSGKASNITRATSASLQPHSCR